MSEKTLTKLRSLPSGLLSGLCYLILFLYSFLLARRGLDVTDSGFNLYQQQLTLLGESQSTALWFSDFLGGLWLSLVSPLGLLGAGLGWCFLVVGFSYFVKLFLKKWLTTNQATIATLLVGLILVGGRLEILYYTNLGAFFLSLGGLCFLTYRDKPQWQWLFCYALLAGMTFGSRFPSLFAFFIFPLVPVIFDLLLLKKSRGFKRLVSLWGATLVGMAFFLILTALSGLWDNYVHSLKVMFGLVEDVPVQQEHGLKFLLNLYVKHLFWRWSWALGYLAFLCLSFWGFRFFEQRKQKTFYAMAVLVVLTLMGFFIFDGNLNNLRAAIGSFSIFTAIFTTIAVVLKRIRGEEIPYLEIFYIQWIFITVSLFSIAGSGVGFLNIHLGQWFTLPAQVVLLKQIFQDYEKESPSRNGLIVCFFISLMPLVLLSFWVVPSSPYRDIPHWEKLNTEFNVESLEGVKSSQQRVKSFGEFLKESQKYVQPGDVTLAYNSVPLFYYLTGTKSYLENPWPTIQGVKAMAFYFRQKKGEKLPRFLFRAITNTQSYYWGNGQIIPPHSQISQESVLFVDNWAQKNGYRIVWSNQDFAILERKGD